jgi:predicted O-linked N-acetylglucosamine transferase (SPINDLY family)
MKHIKLYEFFYDEELKNPFFHLANFLRDSEDEIADRTDAFLNKNDALKNNNESIALAGSLLAALSLGKLSHIAGKALMYIGLDIGAKEESVILTVSKWLNKYGNVYTKEIYHLIYRISEKVPLFGEFFHSLDSQQRKQYVHAVFLATFCFLSFRLSDNIMNLLLSDDFLKTFAEINNAEFADDFANELPVMMNATIAAI